VPFCSSGGQPREGLAETHAFLRRFRARVEPAGRDGCLLAEADQRSIESGPTGQDETACRLRLSPHGPPVAAVANGRSDALPRLPHPCQEMGRAAAGPCRGATTMSSAKGMVTWCPMRWVEAIPQWLSDARGTTGLKLGNQPAAAPLLNGDARPKPPATSLIFTACPACPASITGDETGHGRLAGTARPRPNRTPMAWRPGPNGGFPALRDPACCRRFHLTRFLITAWSNVELQQQSRASLLKLHHACSQSPVATGPALRRHVMNRERPPSVLCYRPFLPGKRSEG